MTRICCIRIASDLEEISVYTEEDVVAKGRLPNRARVFRRRQWPVSVGIPVELDAPAPLNPAKRQGGPIGTRV